MSTLDTLLSTPIANHLGWTLVHFLWQGALVGAVYACLRSILRDSEPQSRYWLSLTALAVLAALPVLTFVRLMAAPVTAPAIIGVTHAIQSLQAVPQAGLMDALHELLRSIVPWTVPAWCAGVVLMALRSFAGWRRIHRLTRDGAEHASDDWQERLALLAVNVGVRMRVRLMITAQIAVPCVVGWLKPVILLPPAALTGLSIQQLEMVLAHELSHIRRHDYLVNLLQLLVETMLFYHPVVRWISQDARRERELCCDDAAVHACGDALHYAHALTDLADIQAADMHLAMGLNGGDLTLRVERLIAPHHVSEGAPRITTLMLATAVFMGGLMMITSARHLPMPFAQAHGMALYSPFIPRDSLRDQRRVPLMPTQVEARGWRGDHPQDLGMTAFTAGEAPAQLDLPAAPPMLPARNTAPTVIEVHNVTIITADGVSDSPPQGKKSMEPLRIISINPQSNAPTQSPHHEYCTPLTGSRVCR